ncbi:MAG: hypothetical protein Q8P65_00810 [bacterium]|nr:hypothetical protein [bacterium]
MSRSRAIAILIIVGFVLYFNVFFNSFLWDDEVSILNNPLIQSVKNIGSFYTGSFLKTDINTSLFSSYYRPVMTTIYTFLYVLFGSTPFFFHFFQITIHILNSILVYLVLFYLIKNSTLSLLLSLVFLVHPINVEAVSFISATQEVLFVFVGLVSLFYLLRSSNLDNKKLLIINFFLLTSLLIKESGILFFGIIFIYLLIFNKKNAYLNLFFSILSLIIYVLIRVFTGVLYVSGIGLFPIMRVSFLTRLITIPKVLFFYISKFFYPINLATSQHWVVYKLDINNFYIPLALIILTLIAICFYLIRSKSKLFLFFFLWLLLGLSIHIQIVPLNMTVAERWFYFPMVGLLGMIGVLLNKIYVIHNKIINIILIIIIVLFSLRSFIRTFDWRNGLTLFSRDIRFSKESFDINNNLGVELFRKGRINEAKPYFEESVKLAPYWWVNWNNLGAYYQNKKNYKKAEFFYKKSISNGDYELAFENYIEILILQKKYNEANRFIEETALKKFPFNQRIVFYKKYIEDLDL